MGQIKQSDLRIGSKVRYQPAHYGEERWENGIVKEIPSHTIEGVRVVYNCNEEWDRYEDYTSAMTCIEDLRKGWR
jgi:hypothetical protein